MSGQTTTANTDAEAAAEDGAIRSFSVDIPEEKARRAALPHHRDALAPQGARRNQSQGVQSEMMQALTRYWAMDYDWRKCEVELNALPQFKTEIAGLDIHFIHVKSAHENALPLILTHGWPGSVIEMLEVIGPLTDPTAQGGRAEEAFDLVRRFISSAQARDGGPGPTRRRYPQSPEHKIRRGGRYRRMRERLAEPEARALYRRRQQMIEPVFAQIKNNLRAERFSRRGLASCRAEWRLIATAHNLF